MMVIPGREPTVKDVDALLSGATPQFAMQLKARVWDLIRELPEGHDVRTYGSAQMALLDEMARGTTRAPQTTRGRAADDDRGWAAIPSHPDGAPH